MWFFFFKTYSRGRDERALETLGMIPSSARKKRKTSSNGASRGVLRLRNTLRRDHIHRMGTTSRFRDRDVTRDVGNSQILSQGGLTLPGLASSDEVFWGWGGVPWREKKGTPHVAAPGRARWARPETATPRPPRVCADVYLNRSCCASPERKRASPENATPHRQPT